MREILSLVCYGLVAFFGVFLSAGFSGIDLQKSTLPTLSLFTAATLVAQSACFYFGGLELTQWFYPLIVHLPTVLFCA